MIKDHQEEDDKMIDLIADIISESIINCLKKKGLPKKRIEQTKEYFKKEKLVNQSVIDTNFNKDIMIPEEVAQYLRVSLSWVYQNWQELGGVKVRGRIFFPSQRDLYERIFCQREGMEVRVRDKQNTVQQGLVQDKNRSQECLRKAQRRNKKSKASDPSFDRHGIWGTGGKPVGLY